MNRYAIHRKLSFIAIFILLSPLAAQADVLDVQQRYEGQAVVEKTATVTLSVLVRNLSEERLSGIVMEMNSAGPVLKSPVVLNIEELLPQEAQLLHLSFDIVGGLPAEVVADSEFQWDVSAQGDVSGALAFPVVGRPIDEMPPLQGEEGP